MSINYMPIAPIDVLKQNKFEPFNCSRSHVMILAHLCKNNKDYLDYYNKTQKFREFTLLDNGAAEASQINDEALIEMVKAVKPTVVIAPDEIFDGEKTIEKTNAFITKIKAAVPMVKLMAVPHGKTEEEYINTYRYFDENPNIDWIGVSKFVNVKPFTDRITCFLKLMENKIQFNKPIHVLGCNNPVEISFVNKIGAVKSIDSCIPYLYKDQEIPLDNSISKRLDTPHEFFDWVLTDEEIKQAWSNIIKIDKLCNF